ncbi:amino acid adenylation domain-containing protein, partial [Chroococcidiopsis sp.]|uniref:amino acid adenylation domain-containing protein n=1 Tax=Chroococcidiopsis sp. TaxID=3088168 RepID=UPI003F364FFC
MAKTDLISHKQKALWFLYQVAPNSAANNVAYAARLVSNVDIPALRQAVRALIERHPVLRTTYTAEHGEPIQKILENQQVCFSVQKAANWSQDDFHNWLVSESDRPFDLNNGPVIRFNLLIKNTLTDVSAAKEVILLMTAHHIVVDFWSLELLVSELRVFYEAIKTGFEVALPPQNLQYKDYVRWENQMLASEQGEQLWNYWREQLAGELPILNLPTDRPRPRVQTYEGASHSFVLGKKLTHKLLELAKAEGVTLYTIVLAAFQVLLLRYTNQEDILIGSPMAGRSLTEFQRIVGYFTNPVVLRADLSGNPTFRDLLCRVHSCVLGAREHQDYPFPVLVERLQPLRDPSRSPLYQVAFAWERSDQSDRQVSLMNSDELIVELIIPESKGAAFDLTLTIFDATRPLKGIWKYNTDLFDADTIERMAGHFQTLLESIVANPEEQISSLPLLTKTELDYLKSRGNVVCPSNPFITFDKQDIEQSIPARFQEQVKKFPQNIAVHTKNYHWTYSELNCRANQVAQIILKCTFGEERIALLFEHDAPMVAGILGVLQIGKAYVPLDPNYPSDRVVYLLEDSGASAVLTNNKNLARAQELTKGIVPLINIDDISLTSSSNEVDLEISPDTIAYILYTSGSTGQPKGVIQSHRNVLYFIKSYTNNLHINEQDGLTLLSSYSFDAALIDIFAAILNGATLYPINIKEEGLTHLSQWLRQQPITIYHSTPTLYRHFVKNLSGNEQLSNIRLVVLGGEEVVKTDVDLYKEKFADECIFVHGLGATESSFYLQYFINKQTEITRHTVSVGYPIEETEVFLINEAGKKTDIYGEIAIRSSYITLGYWHKPNLTQAVFLRDPECSSRRIYCTGDLGRLRPDGSIEFLGRKDFQIKIRGFRIELGEIEAAIAQHPSVRETVVIATEDVSDNKHLVAYVVLTQRLTTDELRHILRRKLPDYMVPSSFVFLDSLPLTPNGKVDRRALRAPNFQLELQRSLVAPRTPIEEMLASIWADVLSIELVGVHHNFFELGGHSLLATQLISRVRDTFGVELPLRSLFEAPTIAEFASRVENSLKNRQSQEALPLLTIPRSESILLSFAQARLWFLDKLQPNSAFYNIPLAWRLSGQLNIAALQSSINEIIKRHEALRTNFTIQEGQPVQTIAATLNCQLQVVNLLHIQENEREIEAQRLASVEANRPFDLEREPLLRCMVQKLGETEYVLLFTMHHIISDGWSLGVFTHELTELYKAFCTGITPVLPSLPVQYADFALWQRQWLQGEILEAQFDYWKQQLKNAPALLELPTARPRPAEQTYQGGYHYTALSLELSGKLSALSKRTGVTLFMTLLAAFVTLLSRITSSDEIIVGTPVAGRNRQEIEGLIGFFVNTIALRTHLGGDPSFEDVLSRVRELALGAYTHQDLPFEQLVEALHPKRDLSYTPLFQVMFALDEKSVPSFELPELTVSSYAVENGTAKFDLTLSMENTADGLVGVWEYNVDLFDETTIVHMTRHFQTLLEGIVANPQQQVSQLPLLTEGERHQILVEWNNTTKEYPFDKCIHQLFEKQVERSPDAIAVVFKGEKLTYRELNQRANCLAHYLRTLGVGSEVLVGICVERSLEMVVSLLGILKAGGAYLPLDPALPKESLTFRLQDAQVPILLTQKGLLKREDAQVQTVLYLDADWKLIAQESSANPNSEVIPENLAYVLYTSGSTGQPKGVAIEHRQILNYLHAILDKLQLPTGSSFANVSTFAADLGNTVIFPALCTGGCLHIISQERATDPKALADYFGHHPIDCLKIVPTHLASLLTSKAFSSIVPRQCLVLGGEAASWDLIEKIQLEAPNCRILNHYGPTETTVGVLTYPVSSKQASYNSKTVPIGRPITNTQVYILDRHQQPVPIGIPGELHIGGASLARGYLNRPDLTDEKFINPFNDQISTRLYKTGDLVRYLSDGNIEFLGRLDRQVKIRGFRIELSEVETAIASHPAVRETVVVAREDILGHKYLAAYIVSNQKEALTSSTLRNFLKEKLPNYMVPGAFVMLNALPLTPNGKVDCRALPPPEPVRRSLSLEMPQTKVEKLIADVWQKILLIEKVGLDDNFFDLGGNSL